MCCLALILTLFALNLFECVKFFAWFYFKSNEIHQNSPEISTKDDFYVTIIKTVVR